MPGEFCDRFLQLVWLILKPTGALRASCSGVTAAFRATPRARGDAWAHRARRGRSCAHLRGRTDHQFGHPHQIIGGSHHLRTKSGSLHAAVSAAP